MSDEVRELQEHIGWLERQLDRIDGIGDTVDNIDGQLDDQFEILGRVAESLKDISKAVTGICNVMEMQNDTVRQLVEGIQGFPDAILKATAQRRQAAQSPFDEVFDHLASAKQSPKRPKFKPTVVKNAPPETEISFAPDVDFRRHFKELGEQCT